MTSTTQVLSFAWDAPHPRRWGLPDTTVDGYAVLGDVATVVEDET